MRLRSWLCVAFVSLLLFSSCTENGDDWDDTVFIEDEENSSLPIYSEMGYNSFGAKYCNGYFRVSSSVNPCQVISSDGSLRFVLQGIHDGFSSNKMMVSFLFPIEDVVRDYVDLWSLDGKEFDLTEGNCQISLVDDNLNVEGPVLEKGYLTFSRAQIVSIDGKTKTSILSGRFGFKFYDGDNIVNMSDGRFDVNVNDDNFVSK